MAHFAEINENNTVVRVIRIADKHENNGEEFISKTLGLGGRWVQTSYNNNFRGNFAGIGYTYDEENDCFVPPQPYPSWILSSETYQWIAPTPYPEDERDYEWNEETLQWEVISI